MTTLFIIVFVDLIGFGLMIPLLPFYAKSFGASPEILTPVLGMYSLGQFLMAPLWGRLSDRLGRRPILITSLSGAMVAYAATAFVPSLAWLFAVRFVAGLMAGNISTATAYVADVTTPETRGKAMGMIGAAFGLGFVLGPALGGWLAGGDPGHADFVAPALAAACLSGIALLGVIFFLKESLSDENRARAVAERRSGRFGSVGRLLKRPELGVLILVGFTSVLAFAGLESTFALWAADTMGWGARDLASFFAGIGIVGVIVQAGFAGRLMKRFGQATVLRLGLTLAALGLALIPATHGSLPLLIGATLLLSSGNPLVNVASLSLISRNAGSHEQGEVMGTYQSIASLSRILGPLGSGTLYAMNLNLPYYVEAAILVPVLWLTLRLKNVRAPGPAVGDAARAPATP